MNKLAVIFIGLSLSCLSQGALIWVDATEGYQAVIGEMEIHGLRFVEGGSQTLEPYKKDLEQEVVSTGICRSQDEKGIVHVGKAFLTNDNFACRWGNNQLSEVKHGQSYYQGGREKAAFEILTYQNEDDYLWIRMEKSYGETFSDYILPANYREFNAYPLNEEGKFALHFQQACRVTNGKGSFVGQIQTPTYNGVKADADTQFKELEIDEHGHPKFIKQVGAYDQYRGGHYAECFYNEYEYQKGYPGHGEFAMFDLVKFIRTKEIVVTKPVIEILVERIPFVAKAESTEESEEHHHEEENETEVKSSNLVEISPDEAPMVSTPEDAPLEVNLYEVTGEDTEKSSTPADAPEEINLYEVTDEDEKKVCRPDEAPTDIKIDGQTVYYRCTYLQ